MLLQEPIQTPEHLWNIANRDYITIDCSFVVYDILQV
jgi:hypothetical protein